MHILLRADSEQFQLFELNKVLQLQQNFIDEMEWESNTHSNRRIAQKKIIIVSSLNLFCCIHFCLITKLEAKPFKAFFDYIVK